MTTATETPVTAGSNETFITKVQPNSKTPEQPKAFSGLILTREESQDVYKLLSRVTINWVEVDGVYMLKRKFEAGLR